LRALSESNSGAWKGKDRPKAIYQLKGGIQSYLATYGKEQHQLHDEQPATAVTTSELKSEKKCLYRGKNFVFDPRRTDPIIGEGVANYDDFSSLVERSSLVGRCIVCTSPHDDYDNGHFPAEEKETRCCRCRVLVLVCNNCRLLFRCWGESQNDCGSKPDLFCGESGAQCVDEGNIAGQVEIVQY
jgi:predicted sulfurtransferase